MAEQRAMNAEVLGLGGKVLAWEAKNSHVDKGWKEIQRSLQQIVILLGQWCGQA